MTIEGLQPRIVSPRPQTARFSASGYSDRIKELDRVAIKSFMHSVNQKRFRHIYLEHVYTRK